MEINKATIITNLLPFHESLVNAILLSTSSAELALIHWLIKTTKIPKDHDRIIDAIELKWNFPGSFWKNEVAEMKTLLLAQKEAAESEAQKSA